MQNFGHSKEEALRIYNTFMESFEGVRNYQDIQKKEFMNKGYVLISEVTGHKVYIPEYPKMMEVKAKFNSEYWEEYRRAKDNEEFDHPYIKEVRWFFKTKSEAEKSAINSPIQGQGALCFKVSFILLFDYVRDNNLFDIVKFCIGAHDECNIECPIELKEIMSNKLVECMIDAGKIFCKNCYLGADINVGDHWIH